MAQQAGAQILDSAVACRIEVNYAGRVTAIAFKRPDGSDHVAVGAAFVVAAHGIETPRLLLMSRSAQLPDGAANGSGQVGRNLMDHPALVSLALARDPVYPYRGPGEISGIEHMRDGGFRSEHAAFRMPIGNDGWSFGGSTLVPLAGELIAAGKRGEDLYDELAHVGLRQVRLAALIEQLPDANNRITLADEKDALGLPRPRIRYSYDEYVERGRAAALKLADLVFDGLSATRRVHIEGFFGAGHILGTYCMGTNPRSSVVDPIGRTHDHRNLFLVGSGVFPTGATANPTLTLAALALRTAAEIAQTFAADKPV
jgi:choline dehydrogenase-like flavoprotein